MSAAKFLKIITRNSGVLVADRCVLADSTLSRLVGLLNHKELKEHEGLMLDPCNQVHTFFMSFPIEAIFLNKEDTVVGIHDLAPWRISRLYFKARKVLEVPRGTIARTQVKIGDSLEVAPC